MSLVQDLIIIIMTICVQGNLFNTRSTVINKGGWRDGANQIRDYSVIECHLELNST